jgi:ribosomal protein L16 Arg81 hydroxylase
MPQGTREAMLEAVEEDRIIVGAYTDGDGGVCPMLAAHRHGGRTNLASFARAWDSYTNAKKPRPATERELRTLRAMLEECIAMEDELDTSDFKQVIAEHKAAKARRPSRARILRELEESENILVRTRPSRVLRASGAVVVARAKKLNLRHDAVR